MARPPQYARFQTHFYGFEKLNWDAKFAKHEEFIASRDMTSEDELEYHVSYEDEMAGSWLIRCDTLTKQYGCEDLRLNGASRYGRRSQ